MIVAQQNLWIHKNLRVKRSTAYDCITCHDNRFTEPWQCHHNKNLWTGDNFCKKKEHGSMKMTAQINLRHLDNGCVTNPGSSCNGCVKRNYSHDSVCTTNYAEPWLGLQNKIYGAMMISTQHNIWSQFSICANKSTMFTQQIPGAMTMSTPRNLWCHDKFYVSTDT